MDLNEKFPMDETEERDIVEMEMEDGTVIQMEVDRYFFYNGEEYVLLVDADAADAENEEGTECLIMKVVPVEGGDPDEEEFQPIEDEELVDKLLEVANKQYMEDTDIDE